MNIKRYKIYDCDCDWNADESPDGDWVKWEDVEKLLALRTAEAKECELMRKVMTTEKTPTGIALCWKGTYSLGGKDVDEARNTTDAARRAAGVDTANADRSNQ